MRNSLDDLVSNNNYVKPEMHMSCLHLTTRGTFRQVPTRRIRLFFVECAYPDLRDLLHSIIGLQWIPL